MVLLIDNFDSFSHILADYFRQLGLELKIERNDVPIKSLIDQKFEALIISPGPGTPAQSGNLLEIIDYFASRIPILGICLGHQAIGEYFGGKLEKGKKPEHGKVHTVYKVGNHPILHGLDSSFSVTRYHSLEITNIPESLEVVLETDHKVVMAFVHKSLPVMGIQYHPEAHLTKFGLKIIRNWLLFSKISVKESGVQEYIGF